jgi:hypothetical protein
MLRLALVVEPLLSKGRKSARVDDRKVINMIFYVLRVIAQDPGHRTEVIKTQCRNLAKPLQGPAAARSMKAFSPWRCSPLRIRPPEPSGSRWATPAFLFQHPAGQFRSRACLSGLAYMVFCRQYFPPEDAPTGSRVGRGIVELAGLIAEWKN